MWTRTVRGSIVKIFSYKSTMNIGRSAIFFEIKDKMRNHWIHLLRTIMISVISCQCARSQKFDLVIPESMTAEIFYKEQL